MEKKEEIFHHNPDGEKGKETCNERSK